MRHTRLAYALLLLAVRATATFAQQDVEKLIEKSDPAIQAQIQKLLDALQKPGVEPRSDIDVCRELQTLKKLNPDKDKLVKQLAIFVVTTSPEETQKSPEETHVLILNEMLHALDLPPRIPIRVLAPYLDTDNRQLRDSVRLWFGFHDSAGTGSNGAPPIRPVNYQDYLQYVEWKVTHKQDVPAPFIKYIFERSPGRALLVFAFANSVGDVTKRRLQDISKEMQARLSQRREIELAEHIISNAIWLDKHGYIVRFQKALPEANEAFGTLVQGEWWARLYVAHIMRQYPKLRNNDLLRQLAEDENELVREAAKR